MKKIFLSYDKALNNYYPLQEAQTCNFRLQDLYFFLGAWSLNNLNRFDVYSELQYEHVYLAKNIDNQELLLWSDNSIKEKADLTFQSVAEKDASDQAYNAYYNKRQYDRLTLKMSIKNYVEIVQKWQAIIAKKPLCLILSQDDSGYVDLIGKDELSEQDLADMKIEHEKYLKYKAAYDKYTKSRPDITDDLWYGPESSEFEADWQKFLDEPLD